MFPPPPSQALLIALSGPAGSGKTTLCQRMLEAFAPALQRVVTATTRAPRGEEQDGVDYHFLAENEFRQRAADGAFHEWAEVHGRLYGTLKSEVDRPLAAGTDLLLNIDVQGAATWRRVAAVDGFPGRLVTVFITPPNLDELRRRLRGRAQDRPDEIERRVARATAELAAWTTYDYCVLSGSRDEDFDRLRSIYRAAQVQV